MEIKINIGRARPPQVKSAPQPVSAPRILLDSPGAAAYTLTTTRALAQYGYMKNAVVYRAIKVISDTCVSVPLKLYTNDNKHTPIDNHPFIDRMKVPNPTEPHSKFLDRVISHWLIAGSNYIFGAFPGTQQTSHAPTGLYVLPPYYVTPQVDYSTNQITAYRYDYGKGFTDYEPWKILPLSFFHPLDEMNGFSPLFAASMAVDRQNEGEKWNISLMQHAARPSGAFISQGNLSEPDFDLLKQEIEDKYTGSNRAGVPMLLEGGLTYQQMGLSPLQIDWLNGDQDAGRKISMAIGVDPLLLNDKQHSTYNNVEQAKIALVDQTIIPILRRYCDEINLWMVPYYGSDVMYDIDMKFIDMLRHDRQSTSIMVVAGWNNGLMGFREGQTQLGIETPVSIPEFYKMGPALFVKEADIPEWLDKQHQDRMVPPPQNGISANNPVGNLIGKNPLTTMVQMIPHQQGADTQAEKDPSGLNSEKSWDILRPQAIMIKYNPYHDEQGRFSDDSGGTGGAGHIDAPSGSGVLNASDQAKLTAYMGARGMTQESMVAQGTVLMEQAMHTGTLSASADWYNRAADAANALAVKNNITPDQAAGVIAALSPRNAWDVTSKDGMVSKPNLQDAMTVIAFSTTNPDVTVTQAISDSIDKVTGSPAGLLGTTKPFNDFTPAQQSYLTSSKIQSYPANSAKAFSILAGAAPGDVLGGPKVRSFYDNIRYPDKAGPVTVDTWMAKLLSPPGTSTDTALKTLNGIHSGGMKATGPYPAYVDAVTSIASKYGVAPHEAQAVMWVQGRING